MASFCIEMCDNMIKEYYKIMDMISQALMAHAGRHNGRPLPENDQIIINKLLLIVAIQF